MKAPVSLAEKALAFATVAHAGVARKWTGEPYVEHVKRVAERLVPLGFKAEVIAAAYLHDVIEDTEITAATLAAEFGPEVAALVEEVTTPKGIPGNRAARRIVKWAHLAESSHAGASIKLADMLDNSSNVTEHDAKFAKLYFNEMREAMKVLGHGDAELYAEMTARLAAPP